MGLGSFEPVAGRWLVALGEVQEELHADGHGAAGVDGFGEGELGGAVEDPFQISSSEAFGLVRDGFDVELGDGLVFGQEFDDLLPGGEIGRGDEDGLIETTGAAEGGVETPGVVRGSDDEDALVVRAEAVELVKELVHEVAHLALADVVAVHGEGVEFVKDEHAGGIGAGGLEGLMEVALGAAEIGVEDLVEADGEVVAPDFAGDGAEHHGLSAAGGAEDEDASAGLTPVGLVEVGVLEGVDDLEADLFFEFFHAADGFEVDLPALGVAGGVEGFGAPFVEGFVEESVVKAIRVGVVGGEGVGGWGFLWWGGGGLAGIGSAAAEVLLESGIGDGGVDTDGFFEALDGAGAVAFAKEHAAHKEVCGGVLGIALEDALDADGRGGGVALKEEDAGDAELGVGLIGVDSDNAVEGLAGFIEHHLFETGVALKQEKRGVLRRLRERFTDG